MRLSGLLTVPRPNAVEATCARCYAPEAVLELDVGAATFAMMTSDVSPISLTATAPLSGKVRR